MFVATESPPGADGQEWHQFDFETWHEVLKSLGCLGMAADLYVDGRDFNLPGLTAYNEFELVYLKVGINERATEVRLPLEQQPASPRFLDTRRSKLLLDIFSAIDTEENLAKVEEDAIGLAYAGTIANAAELKSAIQDGMAAGLAAVRKVKSTTRAIELPPAVVKHGRREDWWPKSEQTSYAIVATSKL